MMRSRSLRSLPVAVALFAALTACADSASTTTAGTEASPAPSDDTAATTTAGGGGSQEGYEGSLITSGLYDATWTVSPEQQADVFNSVAGHTLTSDKETFGNVRSSRTAAFPSAAERRSCRTTGWLMPALGLR
jgi:carbohydrate-selective porin OprB